LRTLKITDGNKTIFYLNFHLKDVLEAEFTRYEGEMKQELALTSFMSYMMYIAIITLQFRSRIEYL